MESHNRKKKTKAPAGKRALLRVGSFVVSVAIALSPGAVPAMTALRAMADKGELVTIDTAVYDDTDREGMYIERLFYPEMFSDGTLGRELEGEQKTAYDTLYAAVKDIAAGELKYTVIENVLVRDPSDLSEPAEPTESTEPTEETPVTTDNDSETGEPTESDETSPLTETVNNMMYAPADDTLSWVVPTSEYDDEIIADMETNISTAVETLIRDIPADLYWFDQAVLESSFGDTTKTYSINVKLIANDSYKSGDNEHVDAQKMAKARAAAEYAANLITANKDKDAMDRANAYCEIVYGIGKASSAAGDYSDSPMIDPKQLAKFFGGESDSLNDCSNAFQYLCNRSNVDCITMTGVKNGVACTWNVITISGKNYLVDTEDYDSVKRVSENYPGGCTIKTSLGTSRYGYNSNTMDLNLETEDPSSSSSSSSDTSTSAPDSSDSSSSDTSTSTPDSSDTSSSTSSTTSTVHSHTPSLDYWANDVSGHWRVCSDPNCPESGEQLFFAPHTPGSAATETTPQTCTVCEYVIAPAIGQHTYSDAWESDSTGHWKKCINPDCTASGTKFEFDQHEPGAAEENGEVKCKTCGFVMIPRVHDGHIWAFNEGQCDDEKHWSVCIIPGCTEIQEEYHTPAPEHKHEIDINGQPTCTNPGFGYDITVCSVCGRETSRVLETIKALEHDWKEDKVLQTTPATCTTSGFKKVSIICARCGEKSEKTETINALGHKIALDDWYYNDETHWHECANIGDDNRYDEKKHNIIEKTTQPANGQPGRREYVCKECGFSLRTEIIPVHDHTYTQGKMDSDTLKHWQVCDECGLQKPGSIVDHTKTTKNEVVTAATCGASGKTDVVTYCTVCSKEISRVSKTTAATNRHIYEKGVCVVCGAKDSDYIEPHTHTASNTWESDTLTHWHVCNVQNCEEKMNVGPHKTDAGTITYPATATMTGLRTYVCAECGKVLRTEVIPVIGSSSSSSSSSSSTRPTSSSSSSSSTRPSSSNTSSSSTTNPLPNNPSNPVDPGSLNISQSTESGANAPRSQIRSSNNTLFNALLTSYERERVQNGESMTVRLTVDNANYSVPDSDKAAVERTVGTLSNFKVGQYLDVNLYKTVGSERKQILASINDLTITFDIPEDIRGKSSYSVIRVHDGNATILRDLDNDPNTITIETSLFSIYAIVYRDQSSGYNPPTGIAESPYIVSTIIGASAFIVMNVIISVVGKKKRKSKG